MFYLIKWRKICKLDLGAVLSVVSASLSGILLEILDKHTRELGGGSIIRILVFPGILGVENLGIDTGEFYWNVQAKGLFLDVVGVEGRSVEDGINNATSRLDGHALADAISSPAPPSINQPSLAAVCVEFLLEEISVASGVEGEECGAEAGGEIGCRLNNASLGTSDLGGVARDEVIHRLTRSQFGNRWQDAEGITCEENNVIWVASHLWLVISIDMEDGVGNTAILGFGHIEVIRHELAILVEQFDILE